jgi:hypothetical protein
MLSWFRRKKMTDNLSSIDEDEESEEEAKPKVKSKMNSSETTDESGEKCKHTTRTCEWVPPDTPSFKNSRLLQQYYVQQIQRGENVNYFEVLKDDVRNMRSITKHQMEYIKKLEKLDLIEIIDILDAVNKTLIGLAGLYEDK